MAAVWGLGEDIAIAQGWLKISGPLEDLGLCRQEAGLCRIFGKKLRGNKDNCGSD